MNEQTQSLYVLAGIKKHAQNGVRREMFLTFLAVRAAPLALFAEHVTGHAIDGGA